ncbi:ATP-binding protein [Oceanicaulis alexandrii]|uniref:ATP-binding protein n=1 Tax=Oceanicaulis alexandrii TaxID=153233 RepID=UPI0035CF1C2E
MSFEQSQMAMVQALFAGMSEAVVAADTQRRIIGINAAAQAMFGYTQAELLGQETRILYADPDDFAERGRTHFNPGASFDTQDAYRLKYRTKSGKLLTADTIAAPLQGVDQTHLGYIGIIRDVSDEVARQDCLTSLYAITTDQTLSRQARIQAILDHGCAYFGLPIGIVSQIEGEHYTVRQVQAPDPELAPGVTFDLSGTYCSQVLIADSPVSYHRAGTSELRTHPCYQTFQLETYIGAPLIVNAQRYGTINFSSPDARERPFTAYDLQMIRMFGQWIGQELSAALHLQALEGARAQANNLQDKAEAASQAKSRFLANMSHEIRTPLNAVMGMTQLLKRTELSDKQHKFVTALNASGDALLNLITDILDLSTIEAGEMQLDAQPTHLTRLGQSALNAVMGAATAKGLNLTLDSSADLDAPVMVDPARLSQVMINLMGNAIKFTPSGSVCLRLSRTDDTVLIEVEDTGIGVADETKKQIFGRFSQGDSQRTREFEGAGLGLSIVREITALHAGSCGVEDAPGGGARFWVRLPAVTCPDDVRLEDTPVAEKEKTGVAAAPVRVLVIDDDMHCRTILRESVSALGWTVRTARNGEDAIEDLKQDPDVDAIIIDLHMPRLSGAQTIRALRAHNQLRDDIPIVFLTADATREARKSISEIEGATYVMKPFDIGDLQTHLQSVVLES